jgi:hypothetical protein
MMPTQPPLPATAQLLVVDVTPVLVHPATRYARPSPAEVIDRASKKPAG